MLIDCNKIPNIKKSAIRKQASSFSFAVYDSVSMINENHWNLIVKDKNEFLQLSYLAALENAPPSNMRFHYALIYDSKKPVAVAYFQQIDFTSDNFGSSVSAGKQALSFTEIIKQNITNHLLKNAHKLTMRILICGNAFMSGENGFFYVPELNPTKAFDALADVIYRISRSEKLRGKVSAVLIKDFHKPSVKYTKELEEYKYYSFLVEPNMVLKIEPEWNSFDSYLNAMTSKYRTRSKKIIKKGDVLERKTLSWEEIEKNSQQIHKLYSFVLKKAKFRLANLSENYFIEMKKIVNEKFSFVAYFLNKKMVGFRCAFLLNNELDAHLVGVDYAINKETELYQNMLYDFVREAIELKKNKINLGRTASEMKSNLGAKAQELTCYARHRNPLSNRIIKPIIDQLKPEEWTPRNPFKEE